LGAAIAQIQDPVTILCDLLVIETELVNGNMELFCIKSIHSPKE